MRGGIAVLCALALAALGGCGGGSGSRGDANTATGATPRGGGGVRLVKVGDFDQPVYVAQPPRSTDLYVVEKTGLVKLVRDGRVETALDLSHQVSTSSEQGLLSIAFPPDFQTSRLVYAYFTGADQNQHVVEFRVSGDGTMDSASRRELLSMQDFAPNHNGGLLLFGPDRHLYIGTGDGGIAGDPERNGQDLGSLLGKILRIDPRPSSGHPYSIPPSNPFAGRPGARPEVFAYGLRNPWRFSFDPPTGALVIGDVGQDSFEEVDYLPRGRAAGANLGWSAYEGNARFNQDQSAPGSVRPVLTYSHDRGCSVTGGFVVRDRRLRSLYGRYLYGDYCDAALRSFEPAGGRAVDDRPVGLTVPSLSSFGEDDGGHIYVTSLSGPVYRLAPG